MHTRTIFVCTIICSLLCAFATASAAQEPSGRIDLDVVSASPFPTFVVGRVAFGESDSACPEDRGTLRISGGTLALMRLTISADRRPESSWQATMLPIDDETQHYRIGTSTCRMDIAVRQQLRRDGPWTSLLVPRQQRPSVPPEERRELLRRYQETLGTPKEPTPALSEMVERLRAADNARRTGGSLGVGGGTFRWPFAFEDKPQTCFEAFGDYRIERAGLLLSFLTGLPGDLNKFVIERTDLDASSSRLHLTRDDCRFELTVGMSILRDGQWVALPLAPVPH
jgi:hypothetical protein